MISGRNMAGDHAGIEESRLTLCSVWKVDWTAIVTRLGNTAVEPEARCC